MRRSVSPAFFIMRGCRSTQKPQPLIWLARIADREEPVTDAIWNEAARHYDETALAALVVEIAAINVWNRFNVATRQVAGEWTP